MAVQALEMSWGERLREEGRKEGREKGQAEGRQLGALEAKRELLLDVLHLRFGEVPQALMATIAQADDVWLSHMHHRAVLAGSLEEVID